MGECVLIPVLNGSGGDSSSRSFGSIYEPDDIDLVCFQPEWLCSRLFGRLFAHERFFQLNPQNLNGMYKLSELKSIFQDVCGDPLLVKEILMAFRLCAELDDDGASCCATPTLEAPPGLVPSSSFSSMSIVPGFVDSACELAALNFLSEPLPLAFKLVKQYANSPPPNKQAATYFIVNGFQIRQSDYHMDMSGLARANVKLPTRLHTSQLAGLFFLIQASLRNLTNRLEAYKQVKFLLLRQFT